MTFAGNLRPTTRRKLAHENCALCSGPVSFETPSARAQAKRILDRLQLPGMAALYDAKGNIVAKAGQALRRPKGLSVVNIGDGYRLCIQRATETVLADRIEWGTALLRRLLHGETDQDAA